MSSRGRQTPWKRAEVSGPRFCARCGGVLSAQGNANPANVCRCTKQQREAKGPADAPNIESTAAE